MSRLTMAIACASLGGHEAARTSWLDTMSKPWPIVVDETRVGERAGYLTKAALLAEMTGNADLIVYLHSDTFTLAHGWDETVIQEFADERVAVAGFFGAKRLGARDIYKLPYDYRQLARADCWSNMTDAEAHGRRTTDAQDVAVIDSFACIVRRSFLNACGGWPVASYPPNHFSDLWISLQAHRAGMRVRLIPIACAHKGGGTDLGGFDYAAWAATTKWRDNHAMHRTGSRMIYDEFRDVLPVEVP